MLEADFELIPARASVVFHASTPSRLAACSRPALDFASVGAFEPPASPSLVSGSPTRRSTSPAPAPPPVKADVFPNDEEEEEEEEDSETGYTWYAPSDTVEEDCRLRFPPSPCSAAGIVATSSDNTVSPDILAL